MDRDSILKSVRQLLWETRRVSARRPAHFGRRLTIEALESREMLAVVPAGFTESQIASGLTSPTSIVVAPDGHIFIAQQNGTIRVADENGLHAQPFATLSVDSNGERGLTGITLDPNFESNGYVYAYYTATSPASHNRVSRLTAQGDTMVPGSEVILFDLPNLSTVGNPIWHMGGAIHFSPIDGKLYVSVGDHQDTSKPQSLNSPFGKILRINADGTIPTDNPFYNLTTGTNRAIYAYGLRNPFTTAFQPETGLFYLNDVGASDWEEINEGFAGANYGWPATEGNFDPEDFPNFTPPIYAYSHDDGCSIVGGVFYPQNNGQFPNQYAGKYFFQDFCSGTMYYLDPSNPSAVATFATDIEFPIDLTVDSQGSMYYLSRGDGTGGDVSGEGALFKIAYTEAVPPQIVDHPDSQLVSVGYPASFSAAASGSSPLSYQWQRSESGSTTWANIPGATSNTLTLASTTLADNGDRFRLNVTNSRGTASSNPATLTITTNVPPTPTITQPTAGTKYNAGQTFTFQGTATDNEDGALPASAYAWQIDFHHNTHSHPFFPPTSGTSTGTFTIPVVGETDADVWYRIHLTVTDSAGLTTSTFFDLTPNTSNLTLNTNIPGIQLNLDDQPKDTPYTVEAVVGVQRKLSAPSTVTVGNVSYQFAGWSDGGAQSHTILTPAPSTTYTANYTPVAVTYLSDLPFVGTPTNGWGPVERDRSNGEDGATDGNPLKLRGTTYTKGLGVHSTSSVVFNLGGTYTTFLADLGIDDETNGGGSVVFVVLADGVSIFDSGAITGTSALRSINLNVTGVNQLTLNVNQSTNGKTDDHADWANARLLSIPPTPPAAPSALTATPLSTTQIRLNWTDNADNETGFQIDRSPNGTTGWTQIATVAANVISYTNTGLTSSTAYYYRVRSTNAGGTSANSNVATATTLVTLPTAPSSLTATTLSSTEIRLNWTDNANNETGFQIDRSPNGTSGWTQIGTVNSNVTTYTNSGLTAATTYFYRVRSANAAGASANSNTASASTSVVAPAAPSALTTTTLSTTQIRLNWTDNASNESGFQIDRSANGTTGWTQIATVGANVVTYTNTGLTAATTYFYRVRANNAGGVSANTEVVSGTTNPNPPSAPSGLGATALSPTEIRLSWTDNSNNESGFQIDRSPNGSSGWTQIGTVGANVTTFNNTGLSPSTQYFYRVRSTNAGGNSANSGTANATTPAVPPAAPSALTTTTLSNTQIRLNWTDNANNETGFQIDRSANGTTGWTQIATVGANVVTYTNTGLTSATTYFYRVRANNGSAVSANTDAVSGTTNPNPPSAPSGLSVTALSSTELRLNWSDNSGNETGFQIDRSANGSTGWTQIGTVGANVTTFTNSGLSSSTQYFYRVRATNAGGNSANSGTASGTTLAGPPSAPTGLTAAALSGSEIRLNWTDTSSNETGFQIDRSLDGTTGWTQVGTVGSNVTTFTNTGLTISTTYFYRVRAVNASGQSANSGTANATTTTQTVTYLSDLPFVGTPVNGWGPVERDRSNGEQGATDGIAMKIGGVTYTKGLGVHSTSQVVFNLGGGYTTFLADIGIDDESGNAGSVIFQVLADGVSIFTSASLTGASAVQSISLNVTGVTLLQLNVNQSTNGKDDDHADWGNARLLSAPIQALTLMSSEPLTQGAASTATTASKTITPKTTQVAATTPSLLTVVKTAKKPATVKETTSSTPKVSNSKLGSDARAPDELMSLLAKDLIQKLKKKP